MLSKAVSVFVFLWLFYIFISGYQEAINAVILYDMDKLGPAAMTV